MSIFLFIVNFSTIYINALVRANYTNLQKDIHETIEYLESVVSEGTRGFSVRTNNHIQKLFEKLGYEEIFGRGVVMEILGLKASGASKLISNLLQAEIIEQVSGYGKGKYKFKE